MVYTDLHIRLLVLQDIEMCFWRGSLLAWAELNEKKNKKNEQTTRDAHTRKLAKSQHYLAKLHTQGEC